MDGSRFSVLLVSARLPSLVARVEVASNREVALGGRHPEVGAARVEDDGELLRGRADADLPKVLRVHVVLERDDVARAKGVGAAEARPLLGGEARGDAAVLVDRALLQRSAPTPRPRTRGGRPGAARPQGAPARRRGFPWPRDLQRIEGETTRIKPRAVRSDRS